MSDLKNSKNLQPEETWAGAEKLLDQHFRRKKRIFWFFMFLFSGLVITGSILLMNHYSKNNNVVAENSVTNPRANSTGEINTIQLGSSLSQNADADKNAKTGHKYTSIAPHSDNVPLPKIAKVHPARISGKDVPPKINHQQKQSNSKQHELNKSNKNNIENTNTNNSNSPGIISQNSVAEKIKVENPVTGNKDVVAHPETTGPDPSLIESLNSDKQEKKILEEPAKTVSDIAIVAPVITSETPVAVAQQNPVLDSTVILKKSTSAQQQSHCRVMVYASTQLNFKNIQSDKFPEYVSRRKNEESKILSNSFGVSLVHECHRIALSVGIGYSSWGEKADYSPYVNQKNVIENGMYHAVSRIDTDTAYLRGSRYFIQTPVQDSQFVSQLDTVLEKKYDQTIADANGTNHFQYIEVPIEVSVKLSDHRLGFGMSLGISPALLLSSKGHYLRRDLNGVENIADLNSTRKWMMNGSFSLDFYYRISERVNFVLRPQVRANLGSVFSKDYEVSQKYYTTGLVYGISYLIH